jgi:hypothetical protein
VKASISARIACECLIDQEKANKKLVKDHQKLSRNFKLPRAANSDLEKKVSELAEALKSARTKRRLLKRLMRIPEKILKNFGRHMTMICD